MDISYDDTKEIMSIDIENSTEDGLKYKKFLPMIVNSSPKINSIEWIADEDGNHNGMIKFIVNVQSLGISSNDIYSHTKQLFSNFIVDFIGQLIIRNNITMFINEFVKIEDEDYMEMIFKRNHTHFGVQFDSLNDKLIFTFHASLIHDILTEEFKRI